jgi:type I restriction enzyme M protein
LDVFTRQFEIPKYSRMVPISEISDPKNDYNLNIPRYIDNTEEEDVQDIAAHLLGGIPERDIKNLSAYWDVFKTLRGKLFINGKRKGYSEIKVDAANIRQTIFSHPEFVDFTKAMKARFNRWMKKNQPLLTALKVGSHPKALIEALSENLLATFADSHLIDPYDIYQHLMTYWTETMQDDVYMISSDGWKEACKLRLIIEDENKKIKEKPDLTIGKLKYKADLIPPSLIVARYFAKEQKVIEDISAEIESLTQQMDTVKEEHGGEEGLLYEVIDEKGKISKNAVVKRLKDIKGDTDAVDERKALEEYFALLEKEAKLNKRVKENQKKMDETVAAQYTKLSVEEIKTLVVDEKWLTTLATDMDSQIQNIAFQLANRIKELAERYTAPLPELTDDVVTLSGKVNAHLKKMGFKWK